MGKYSELLFIAIVSNLLQYSTVESHFLYSQNWLKYKNMKNNSYESDTRKKKHINNNRIRICTSVEALVYRTMCVWIFYGIFSAHFVSGIERKWWREGGHGEKSEKEAEEQEKRLNLMAYS